jgi:tryptophanyl-tRNA synthetase
MSRVFSGIQPTGDGVHLGNYLGAIVGMLELQQEHECVFAVVDLHATTVPYDPRELPRRVLSVALDYLAAGIDPKRSILMVQSDVREHVELAWILGCLVTVNKLAQLPIYKDKLARHGVAGLGLLSYPVLMAADILLYKAGLVPVGKDQLPHIEFAREAARAFNGTFGQVFPEPHAHLTSGAVVPSLLGQGAMSKSVPGSFIALTDEPTVIADKLARAVTDPARQRRKDAGEPAKCNVFTLHGMYTPSTEAERIAAGCRAASTGCLECKALLAAEIAAALAPIRDRRRQMAADPGYVLDVLCDGAERARVLAEQTMGEVRQLAGLSGRRRRGGSSGPAASSGSPETGGAAGALQDRACAGPELRGPCC